MQFSPNIKVFRLKGQTFRMTSRGEVQHYIPVINNGMGSLGGIWKKIGTVALVAGAGYLGYQGYQNYQATGNIFKSAPITTPTIIPQSTSGATGPILNNPVFNTSPNYAPQITWKPAQVGVDYPNFTPITRNSPQWSITPTQPSGGGYDPKVGMTGNNGGVDWAKTIGSAIDVAGAYLTGKAQINAMKAQQKMYEQMTDQGNQAQARYDSAYPSAMPQYFAPSGVAQEQPSNSLPFDSKWLLYGGIALLGVMVLQNNRGTNNAA